MRLLIALAAATLLAGSAFAQPGAQEEAAQETIYVSAGTAMLLHTETAFRGIHVGDNDLLTVTGVTDHDLVITAKRADGVLIESANVLLLDDQGNPVRNIRVEVTPFAKPSTSVAVIAWGGKSTYYRCGEAGCLNAASGRARNGPDSTTITKWSDGSSSTSETYNKK